MAFSLQRDLFRRLPVLPVLDKVADDRRVR
jgi:hypothetical protein